MSDRPILFSGPMVRAILEGRKTQTRRILNPQPNDMIEGQIPAQLRIAVGDRLWVRETHRFISGTGSHNWDRAYQYRADDAVKYGKMFDGKAWALRHGDSTDPWRPSIHMPRWASRLTLIVTDVRVQRLQDISEEDAMAEGATMRPSSRGFRSMYDGWSMDWGQVGRISRFAGGIHPRGHGQPLSERDISLGCARMAFASYWDSIANGAAWVDNPWVVAITFTVHRCNIDATLDGRPGC